MDSPASGIPSPPMSCHGSPSSFASELPPSMTGSLYSLLTDPSHFDGAESDDHDSQHGGYDYHSEWTRDLVIPSILLPSSLLYANGQHSNTDESNKPGTVYGETLGNLNLLVTGKRGCGKLLVSEGLVVGNKDVLDIGTWESAAQTADRDELEEDSEGGRILLASTKPSNNTANSAPHNVKIQTTPGWDDSDEPENIVEDLLQTIRAPFQELDTILQPLDPSASNGLIRGLLASGSTPLWTAVILILSSPPTHLETRILTELSSYIPIIPFSPHAPHHHYPQYAGPRISREQRGVRTNPSNPNRSQSRSTRHSRQTSPHTTHHHLPQTSIAGRLPSFGGTTASVENSPRSGPPPRPKWLSNVIFHPASHSGLRDGLFRSPSILEALRFRACEKFLRWRHREGVLRTYLKDAAAGEGSINTLKDFPDAPLGNAIGRGVFERFAFDAIADDLNDEVFFDDKVATGDEDEEDERWKADLSRALAIRKQKMRLTRSDTVRPVHREPGLVRSKRNDVLQSLKEHLEQQYMSSGAEADVDSNSTTSASGQGQHSKDSTDASSGSGSGRPPHLDPLHFPSLLSLMLSIVPDMKARALRFKDARLSVGLGMGLAWTAAAFAAGLSWGVILASKKATL
ncbi:hypothetical protein FRC03_007172 [Tulasnella sp. 419]|nr:hypothetical protein FRC02_009061 [Tulasnella sp. 418]KAG8968521.1 hypothetical protein FRC03_007172 [Tulasnella sp. 419]